MLEGLIEPLQLIAEQYIKILRINLTTDTFRILKADDTEFLEKQLKTDSISTWLYEFAQNGYVFEADVDMYKMKTNTDYLKNYFKSPNDKFMIRYRRKVKNIYIWTKLEIIPAKNFSQDNMELVLYVQNINDEYSQDFEKVREMERFCNNDTLTGLNNFTVYKTFCIRFANERQHDSIGVLFADLNGLKIVNDTQGHEAGNTYIRSFGKILKNIYNTEMIFRLGGDEFIVIFRGCNEQYFMSGHKALLDRLNEDRVPIASVGYAWSSSPESINEVVNKAEKKMYEVKHEFYEKHPEYRRSAIDETLQMEINATISYLARAHAILGQIDLDKDKYMLIKENKENRIHKDNWSDYIESYARERVSKSTRGIFLKVAGISNLREKLKTNDTVSHDFELYDGRWMHASYCKISSRDNEPSKVLFYCDFSDPDRVKQLAETELMVRNYKILENLCSSYSFIGILDKESQTINLYDTKKVDRDVMKYVSENKYNDIVKYFSENLIEECDRERFLSFGDMATLPSRFKGKSLISGEFSARKSVSHQYKPCNFYFFKPVAEDCIVIGIRKKSLIER